jgi:peptidyl-dipeptidase Dcp
MRHRYLLIIVLCAAVGASAPQTSMLAAAPPQSSQTSNAQAAGKNPFFDESTLPFQAPPFDKIKDADYQPALEEGMRRQLAEVEAVADNKAAPTFDNTVVALERTGSLLARVSRVFFGLTQADTNPTIQKVEAEETPKLARTRFT